VIANKEALLSKLKSSLSKALLSFDGKGLTVEQRNGKVYVSMENKLLFKSGSWAVGSEGKLAIKQLAMVLEQNKDISVLIEGHTDDDPYIGDSKLSGNWDLSVKRATAIVSLLLQNKGVMPENITAAGKGEYSPLVPNSSADNRSKNRRIEVILAPKLDEIGKLLQDLD
jgi:chemotaxis protein MotB